MELIITEININEGNCSNKKPTICLNMIVKNEANVILNTLENINKYIYLDYWVISDTGSTDTTQDVIKDYFYKKGIPGELVEHRWKDFGYNRSKALECAYGKTDYVFIFDADDLIYGDFKLPFYENDNKNNDNKNDKPYADRYMLKMGTGLEYVRPLLINNQKRWMFKGVLHEFLSNMEPVNEDQTIIGDYYIDSGRTGNRSQNPTKYYDDAIILEKAYAEEMKLPDQGLSGRYAFYCGRSYKDAGEKYFDKAIEWYKTSLTSNNWVQEKYYSALEIGIIYKEQNNTKEALHFLFKTIEYDMERMEGLIFIIDHFYQEGFHILVNALYHKFKNTKCKNINEKLFVIKNMYNDRLEFFNGISAYYANDKQSGYECCKQVLINQRIGENELNVTMNNFIFYIEEFIATDNESLDLFYAVDNIMATYDTISHNQNALKVWNIIFNHNQPKLTAFNASMIKKIQYATTTATAQATASDILLTFTTCKRLDLFKKTVNSILNHWTDCEKIKYWFCVDDNSNEEDRNDMKKTYNWINYYMKNPEEKGHRASMNIIWNKLSELKPTYWIHIEDDFLFYHKTDYITQAITAFHKLHKNPDTSSVNQILFNRNYAETIENYTIRGHVETSIPTIVLHNHYHNSKNNYPNAHYWPHYSFRPSIINVSSILKLGNYDSPNQFFEKDYADKWNEANYKSAFFNRITCRHIGRLTKERNETDAVENAYQLNKENQFINNASVETIKNVTYKPIKIINLERRDDRKQKMIELMEQHEILPNQYELIKAIDGTQLIPSQEIKTIFDGNDFGSRQGVIGCALSHLNLWRELLNDPNPEHNYYIIFEDDITVTHGMKKRLVELEPEMKEREMLFMGYSMFENKRKEVSTVYNTINITEISNTNPTIKINELNKDLYIGGFFAYSINKAGAQKLVDYIDNHGIKHGIDYLIKIIPDLSRFELQPQIVFSEWNENDKTIDTDIQNNYNSLDFTKVIDDHFTFHSQVDQIGHDIYFNPIKNNNTESIRECMIKALNDDNCSGFNTLGFFKNKIDTLIPSIYFGEKDGIYIKKNAELNNHNRQNSHNSHNEYTIRVKLLCNWCSSKQLCNEWSNMCNGKTYENIVKNKWNTIEITSDDNNIDYYVIINHPLASDENSYVPERTIIFQMEPWVNDSTKDWGVKTWGKWASPDETKFLKIFTHKNHLNNVQWQIDSPFYNKEFNELLDCTYKRNKIAAISSFKNFDTGHILRNDFIRYIENISETNMIEIDVFGRENYHHFKSYCGQIKDDNKYNVYSNYRYCLAVENNSEKNYATEKIWEGILCESLCFYWGCPNLEEYIDPKAFVRLPLEDYDQAYKIIQQAIAEDWWSQRIEIIKETKQKLLHELGFFPLLEKTLKK